MVCLWTGRNEFICLIFGIRKSKTKQLQTPKDRSNRAKPKSKEPQSSKSLNINNASFPFLSFPTRNLWLGMHAKRAAHACPSSTGGGRLPASTPGAAVLNKRYDHTYMAIHSTVSTPHRPRSTHHACKQRSQFIGRARSRPWTRCRCCCGLPVGTPLVPRRPSYLLEQLGRQRRKARLGLGRDGLLWLGFWLIGIGLW